MSFANPLAHGASPGPLNTGSPGPALTPDLDRSTWQREMERAMSAAWFQFDDAARAATPEPRAQPAASTPSSRVAPAPVAAARAAAQSHATPKSAPPAGNDDGSGAGPAFATAAPRTIARVKPAPPAPGLLAADGATSNGAMPATGETLPASIPAVAPSMAKLPSTAALAPSALPPGAPDAAPIVHAPLVQPVAAALIAALAASPQAGTTHGGTTEEPLPSAPPAPPEDIPQALRDLFGPLPGEVTSVAPSEEIEEASAPATAREEPSAESAPPLRWHAEWDEQGVRVWLGLDSAAGIDAPQLAQQVLQSLGEQGARVLSLVCNGKALYGAATPRDSNPRSDRRGS